jgi:hypothetical protein
MLHRCIKLICDKIPQASSTPQLDIKQELTESKLNPTSATYPNIIKLFNNLGYSLELSSVVDQQFMIMKEHIEIKPIKEVIKTIKKIKEIQGLPSCPSVSDATKIENSIKSQMNRIKDGRSAATKMTLMHLVTGQGIKHYMVKETIQLCTTLYNATNLNLAE